MGYKIIFYISCRKRIPKIFHQKPTLNKYSDSQQPTIYE